MVHHKTRDLQLLSSLEALYLPIRHHRSHSLRHNCSSYQIIQAACLRCCIDSHRHNCFQPTQTVFLPTIGRSALCSTRQHHQLQQGQQHCFSSPCQSDTAVSSNAAAVFAVFAWLMSSALFVSVLLPTGNFCSFCQSCSGYRKRLLSRNQFCWYLAKLEPCWQSNSSFLGYDSNRYCHLIETINSSTPV